MGCMKVKRVLISCAIGHPTSAIAALTLCFHLLPLVTPYILTQSVYGTVDKYIDV